MSLIRQQRLLPAGCQPWNNQVCAASTDRFAFCATLAVYIYQFDEEYNEFRLHSIMSAHKKTVTSLAWCIHQPDLLVTCGADNRIIIWNVVLQRIVSETTSSRGCPTSVGWCPHDRDVVTFTQGRGPVFLWNHRSPSVSVSTQKDTTNMLSEICIFRWHPQKTGKLALGHADGSLSFFLTGQKSQRHVLRPEPEDGSDPEEVTSLEWDPLSTDYLLVAVGRQGLRLIDTVKLTVITMFQLPSSSVDIQTMAWVNTAPGMFLTGDRLAGVLRIWTVSKTSPVESLRVKKTGFHAMSVLHSSPHNRKPPALKLKSLSNGDSSKQVSSTGSSTGPSVSAMSRYALPPAHVVCTFLDGGVGMYDLSRRTWMFLKDQGHIETIFDCKFKPDDPYMLATSSFDGTIKVWNIETLTAVHSSTRNESVVYSVSWGPPGINCLVAGTSKNGIFIWDFNKNTVIKRFNDHGKQSVFCVAWNQKDAKIIASSGSDQCCIIRQVDGQPVIKYHHPGTVYGCEWNPNNKDLIATGCEDCKVRVYYLATTTDKPMKVFSGHTAKVFHVRWSPLRDGILCSGSDDGTIHLWDYTADGCVSVLHGHTAPVRGLLWNPEIPYLLVSGSWDHTIKIWDTRDGACLDDILDHGADVYGLTSHPEHPFLMASCSRDSTVRLWSMMPLAQPIPIKLLANRPWSQIITSVERGMTHGSPPLLSGRLSREIKLHLDQLPEKEVNNAMLIQFSKFFLGPVGSRNLWDLASAMNGADIKSLSSRYRDGIVHHTHLTRFKSSSAQELEMARISRFGQGLGAPSREDKLKEAAKIHISLGNVQRYCELQVELGQWERALAVAPGVSVEYWRSLANRYASSLMIEESDDAVPFCMAAGEVDTLVEYFISCGRLQEAMVSAAASNEGTIPQFASPSRKRTPANQSEDEGNMSLMKQVSGELSGWYLRSGQPIQAACCHLSVDDLEKALSVLIQGNELILAVSLGRVMESKRLADMATVYLARRCEKLGYWDLAVDLLMQTDDSETLMAQTCARCAGSMAEVNALHKRAGFPDMEECQRRGQDDSLGVWERMKYYLLSPIPGSALTKALPLIKDILSEPGWSVSSVDCHLQMLACITADKLHNQPDKERHDLLALCSYIGALKAIARGYTRIVKPLFTHARELLTKAALTDILSDSLLSQELQAWQTSQGQGVMSPSATAAEQQTMQRLNQKIASERDDLITGEDQVAGCHLPSHSDVHYSSLTGERIQGQAFFLEDGKQAISLNEALMWAKVNPFSPVGSGCHINPF